MCECSRVCLLNCCTERQTFSIESLQPPGVGRIITSSSNKSGDEDNHGYALPPLQPSGSNPRSASRRSNVLGRAVAAQNCLGGASFLEEFQLAEVLGHGSFSIVMACKAKKPDEKLGQSLAVKLVEKVDARPEDIEQEIKLHMKLEHPNVLKMHKVFHEKCFICMIVDNFKGGSLVSCLQDRKQLICGRIVHIGRQMVQAVEYIHSKRILHRDIKADNFLADTKDLMDQSCHVVLADFGFACECYVGDRLKRQCGTQWYWSPEVWDKNYELKADLWALGTTFHCLIESSFPFLSEWDVKHKEVALLRVVSPTLAAFIRQLLCKQEGQRLSAAEALAHPWLSRREDREDPGEEVDVRASASSRLEAVKPEMPDAAAAERRLELLERFAAQSTTAKEFQSEATPSLDSEGTTTMSVLASHSFSVSDKRACKIRTFEWWPTKKLEECGMLNLGEDGDDEAAGGIAPARSSITGTGFQTQMIAQLLEDFGVDTSLFGKGDAKSLQRFAEEVESGFSNLMLDASKHKALVRVVEVVLLRICMVRPGGEERFMIVSGDEQADGRVRGDLNRLPGTKKLPHENVRNAALRTLGDIPELVNTEVIFDFEHTELFEVEEESPSYPGVRTVYRKSIVAGVFRRGSKMPSSDWAVRGGRSTKFLEWLSEEECAHKNVTLTAPILGTEVSCLVPAPLGLKVEALGRYLEANNVDLSMFGQNGAKTLKELSDELLKGESTITCLPCGRVARIVDVVVLKLVQAGTSDTLVVAKEVAVDGTSKDEILLGRLPGSKRRPDESHFMAAKRVLRRQLNLGENRVTLDAECVHIVEVEKDSPSYPGLHTIYRRRIIPATLDVMQPQMTRQFSSNSNSNSNLAQIQEEPGRRSGRAMNHLSLTSMMTVCRRSSWEALGRVQKIKRNLANFGKAVVHHRAPECSI